MTPEQRKLARHALGFPKDYAVREGRTYRNRYYITAGVEGRPTQAYQDWVAMCHAGEAESFENGRGFALTLKGAQAALYPGEHLDKEDFPDAP